MHVQALWCCSILVAVSAAGESRMQESVQDFSWPIGLAYLQLTLTVTRSMFCWLRKLPVVHGNNSGKARIVSEMKHRV
jgi:hypothetical protein